MNHTTKITTLSLCSLLAVGCGDDGPAAGDGGTDTDDAATGTTGATDSSAGPTSATTAPGDTTAGDPDSGPGTDDGSGSDTGDEDMLAAVWASANPAGLDADRLTALPPSIDAVTASLSIVGDATGIQSITLDASGDGYITFDHPDGGGIMIVDDLDAIAADATLGLGDRVIMGPATGLVSPKGIAVVASLDLILVADTGAGDIKGFALDAQADAAPMITIDDLGGSPSVWDMHYDAASDALYAAGTNGDVQVFDDFAANLGLGGPDRTIVPTMANKAISVNLHGIEVVGDELFVTDVGDAMDPADGQLLVLADADTADGAVDVDQRIDGNMLGNPVDLVVRPGIAGADTVYVAEKSNDAVLAFSRVAFLAPFGLAEELEITKAESVALDGTGLVVSSNPAGRDADAALRLDGGLGGLAIDVTLAGIGSVSSIQSVLQLDDGSAWVTFDGPAVSGGAGLLRADDLAALADGDAVSASASRIWGPATGLVAPKGLTANAAGDMIFVADVGASDIKVFDGTLGDTAPIFVITDVGDSAVWDIAYDEASDRLFAAGTNGSARVFDDVSTGRGASGPDRVIRPTDGANAIGINLHGIAYDAATDNLLVTDVGDPMSAEDGAIFVIAGAAAADGDVEVTVAIAGASTMLGNPVDLAFDGVDAYVAEKSNSQVMRWDAILDDAGMLDAAADASVEVQNAESVTLRFR